MARHRNITRIDNDRTRTHGWVFTVQRRGNIVVRSFADGSYGGKKKALAAAVACRELLHAQHSAFEHQVWVRTRLRKNNRSGIPGVARYEVLANPNTGRREVFWQAAWVNERGLSRKRKFSVFRFGERQAKRLAIAERERQLQRVCAVKDETQEARPGGWVKRL